MTTPSREVVLRVFELALNATALERSAVLDRECKGDAALRAKVEALLKAEAGGSTASPDADDPARARGAAAQLQEQAGAQIGRYKLLEQIGEGGMGTIWMAEQREPVKRRVALKIIKLGMDTKQVIARFEAERQALALMDHPHIAKVLDAGATDTGRPYFVMEYIKGIPILEYCDKERLDTTARLELFTNVCHAIQHAHHKGIIHRDIKPSNVLVTLHDGVPVPKVIDFGIAKATNSELTTKTLFTEHRQMIGTPAYMSPEQAELSGLDIDTRSDIYALGVLLYELLTGTTPLDTKALLVSGYNEMLRAIREDEPHKPSTRISSLGDTGTRTAQQRKVDLKKLTTLLRGDLDWIVMKCLEKDRTRRYETANGLAADIKRHLSDEPVTAGAPSAGYKLRKFVRRNRAHVIAASFVITALLVALVGTSWGWVEKSRARSAEIQRRFEDEQRTTAEHARLLRSAEAMSVFLVECEDALRTGDEAKAQVALDAARQHASEGGAGHDAERLARLDADLVLATELDAIDQFRWTWTDKQFGDPAVAAKRTRSALRRFGADAEAVSVEEAVKRVNASAIRGQVILSIDRLLLDGDADTLRTVLRRVDADPFRDAYRDAVIASDQGNQGLLADSPAALDQPPEFIAALGLNGAILIERRRELLERALVRQPSDLALLMTLQGSYTDSKDSSAERVRWLQAAIAADPSNSGAYTNLGMALRNAQKNEEALACNWIAVALNPQNAVACNNLGSVLIDKGQAAEALIWIDTSIAINPGWVAVQTNRGKALVMLGRVDEAIECYRKAAAYDPKDSIAYALWGDALKDKGQADEAIVYYKKAIELDPGTFAYGSLGEVLQKKGELDEAIVCYRKAVEHEPKNPFRLSTLGDALRKKQLDEAIACYRNAIALDPKYDAYGGLGVALKEKGELDEALTCLRKSMELRPDYAPVLWALSGVLGMKGRLDEALLHARKGVELMPNQAEAHLALGNVLYPMGEVDESSACYRRAIELDPKGAIPHHNLGASAVNHGKLDEALSHYRRSIELEPGHAQWHLDLALVLHDLDRRAEARESFQKSLELDPNLAVSHYYLGMYQADERRLDDAIESYRKAIAIYPNYAEAHCNLASCLQNKGRFAEALQSRRRGHELGSQRADWRYPSAEWVANDELLVALEARLPALLEGKLQPADNDERVDFARMCHAKGLYRESAGLAAEAFAADPKLADDLDAGLRRNAAGSAALAAAASGEAGAQIDERERARWRKQAGDWLRADLVLIAPKLETEKRADRAAVGTTLREWQEDSDFASIRDAQALALLPAEEQTTLAQLWADVATLVSKAQSSGTR